MCVYIYIVVVVVVAVRVPSHVWLFATPWTAACQASLSLTISQSVPKFMSIESVTPSNHLILCHPLLLLPSIIPSIRDFSNESDLHIRWPKYWSFSFNINEYSGLISFRIYWFDLLAVQGTLKSLLQHHSSKASILWHSAYFMAQLSQLYMTTGNTSVYIGSIYSIYYWLFHWRTLTNAANRCSLRAGPLNLHLFCLYFNKKITLEAQCCWSNYRWDRDHLFFQFDSVLTAKTEILAVIHLLDQITPYLEIVTR